MMNKGLHTVTLRVDTNMYQFLRTYSTSISISTNKLLQIALERDYCAIYDPYYQCVPPIKYHITTKVDRFILSMIEDYAVDNAISKGEAVRRLIEIVLDCEGLRN